MNRVILHRLRITKGHLDKVIRMVEANDYCIDVVHQSMAVGASLKSVEKLILKNHMRTCVADSINRGESGEFVEEIIKVVEKT